MSFEGTSQDSRDPNSPQWGYLRVQDPKTELQYPSKDTDWNEYVLFVHDQNVPELSLDNNVLRDAPNGQMVIEAEKGLKCLMVPATLTINYDLNDIITRTQAARNAKSDTKSKGRYDNYLERLNDPSIPSGPINITIGGSEIPDDKTLWVALVIGTP